MPQKINISVSQVMQLVGSQATYVTTDPVSLFPERD